MSCPDLDLDRPEAPEAVRHLESCDACRREADARRRLRDALRALPLPAPPRRRSSRAWPPALATAAAAALVLALFLALPTPSSPLPELVQRSSDFHDQFLDGQIRLRDPEALRALGLKVLTPELNEAALLGGCPCALRERESASPWVLYKVRGQVLSLFVVESSPPALPDSARRSHQGRDYWIFRCNRNTILVCQSGSLCHLWISRMDESQMLATVLATQPGQLAFSGERLTLRGVT